MEIGEAIAMESKGMFEKNLRFAYWYVRKHFPAYADDEDIMQEALIGLWKASQTYNSSQSKFTTYAGTCIYHQVLMALRKTKKLCVVSLESPCNGPDSNCWKDLIEDPCGDPEDSGFWLKEYIAQLSGDDQVIISLLMDGKSQTDIGEQIGKSQASVSRRIKKIKTQFVEWR